MAFNGKEGGAISLEEASQMTANYRGKNPNSTIAHFFGKDILSKLINVKGAKGIRMYYGIDSEGNKQLVLVAADADQNDILELIVDVSSPCPNWCSELNPLNS